MKFVFSPDVTFSGCLGSKHQPTTVQNVLRYTLKQSITQNIAIVQSGKCESGKECFVVSPVR